jgi:hypothetical protein
MRKRLMTAVLLGLFLGGGALRAEEAQTPGTTAAARDAEFLVKLSTATQIPMAELKPLGRPGLGRIEVLVLALLHKKAGADLTKLLDQRKKKIRLSRLINQENQDEREIYQEAWALRKQIDGK